VGQGTNKWTRRQHAFEHLPTARGHVTTPTAGRTLYPTGTEHDRRRNEAKREACYNRRRCRCRCRSNGPPPAPTKVLYEPSKEHEWWWTAVEESKSTERTSDARVRRWQGMYGTDYAERNEGGSRDRRQEGTKWWMDAVINLRSIAG
jgi:hypothetical protein